MGQEDWCVEEGRLPQEKMFIFMEDYSVFVVFFSS